MSFFLAGAVMLVCGLLLAGKARRSQAAAATVDATVTSVDYRRSNMYVGYIYNGQAYSDISVGYYSGSIGEGSQITLFIDPQRPDHIVMNSQLATVFKYMFFSMILFGVVLMVVGIVPMVCMSLYFKKLKKASQKRTLLLRGTVEEVRQNRLPPRPAYTIYCTYKDIYMDVVYRFSSGLVTQPPGYVPGDFIDVYVDPDDYGNYEVIVKNKSSMIIDFT